MDDTKELVNPKWRAADKTVRSKQTKVQYLQSKFGKLMFEGEISPIKPNDEKLEAHNKKKSELLVAYSQYSTALEELLSTVFDIQKDLKDILKEQSSLIADSRKKTSKPKTKSKKK